MENALKKKNTSPVKLLKMFFLKIQTFPLLWLNNQKLALLIPPCADEKVHDETKRLRGGPGAPWGQVTGQEGWVTVLVTQLTVLGNQVLNNDGKIRIRPLDFIFIIFFFQAMLSWVIQLGK